MEARKGYCLSTSFLTPIEVKNKDRESKFSTVSLIENIFSQCQIHAHIINLEAVVDACGIGTYIND